MNQHPAPSVPSVAVIGAGRLGAVLARALREAGLTVSGPHRREDLVPRSDVALLCVPDSEISAAASAARGKVSLLGHVSGATTLTDVDFSMHPMQTFTGSEAPEVFQGIGCAVAGRTPEAQRVAVQLAEVLGARAVAVGDEDRAAYHAAASLASNLVLTVLDAAEHLAAVAGIEREDARALLAPLVRRTVENWEESGAAAVLTGPIARGDEFTVNRQRAAVMSEAPDLVTLFDELCAQTRELAGRAVGEATEPKADAA